MKKLLASVIVALTILVSPLAYSLEYFQSEQAAHQHCPKDVVVWLNTRSGVWHYKGQRWYAQTKNGAFVCRKEAATDGDRGTKNGQ